MEFKGSERFHIRRRLGAGGFGIVYQVYDRERDSVVALKSLNNSDAESLYRFKREFRSLADVVHPNLVTLYELLSDGDQWRFTMELVVGLDFLNYVRGSALASAVDADDGFPTLKIPEGNVVTESIEEAKTLQRIEQNDNGSGRAIEFSNAVDFDAGRLRDALKQLAEGVSALHDAGKLHRDLKPSNVLVTKEGRVVILDFGLVTELDAQSFKRKFEFIGTPLYMSPEQGAGGEISEASDWYSVGVMLYEALTGRPPFTGQLYQIIADKQSYEPQPPSVLAPGVPQDLDALCVDLLRCDPSKRPTGKEVLRRLGAAVVGSGFFARNSPSRAALFVGRERHLDSLNDAFAKVKAGRAVTVQLHGSSGMGKTATAYRFFEYLRRFEPESVILMSKCYEQENVPYKAVDGIVDALSRYLKEIPSPAAKALMPSDAQALARLFPVLQKAVTASPAEKLDIPDSLEQRRRAFGALRELLVRLAGRKPLVLFIDDLQWGDLDSAALLSELLRPPDPPPMLLIASYRSEEAETSPLLQELFSMRDAAGSSVDVREIAVKELAPAEARDLAQSILSEKQLDSIVQAEAIAAESGGSPFFINELVRYTLTVSKKVPFTESGSRNKYNPAEETIRLDEVIWARVQRLPENARILLEAVALAGRPLERAAAKLAAGLEDDEHKTLALLRADHLIRSSGANEQERLETYHDRIRETVVSRLSPEALKNYHYRLAAALEAAAQPDPERLAVHFKGAGDLKRAAEYAIAAADQAAEALAFDRAAQLYRLTLEIRSSYELDASPRDFCALRVKLGDALANSGQGVEAAKFYLEAVKGSDADKALELQRRAAEQLLRSGRHDEGLEAIRAVLDSAGIKPAESPRGALVSLLMRRAWIKLRGLSFRERMPEEIAPQRLLCIDACWSIVFGLAAVDNIRGADFQARHLLLALEAGEPYRIARALAAEIGYCATGGNRSVRRTKQLISAAEALAERLNHPHVHALLALATGTANLFEGRWKQSLDLCSRAEEILRKQYKGGVWELDTAQIFLLRSMLWLGEMKKIFHRLPALIEEAESRGDLYLASHLQTRILYLAHLAKDEPQRAEAPLRSAIDRWSQKGFHSQHLFALIGRVEIALYSGDGKRAREILIERWPALVKSLLLRMQLPKIESLHLRARAALAEAADSAYPSPLLAEAENDCKLIEREKTLYGNALALFVRSGISAARGETAKAVRSLESAEAAFESAEMALYKAAARRNRGELLGGEHGRTLIESADVWMKGQEIRRPDRFAAMLCPWKRSGLRTQ